MSAAPKGLALVLQPDASRLTWPRLADDACVRHGDRTALRFESHSWSYRVLAGEIAALRSQLLARGVAKGTRVALLMSNRPEWVIASFAATGLGAVLVPINTFATRDELDYILRHCDASLLMMQTQLLKHDFLGDLLAAHPEIAGAQPGEIRCAALPQLRRVLALGLEEPVGAVEVWPSRKNSEPLAEEFASAIDEETRPDDDALIIYTSGTTARPKAILHAHQAAAVQSYRFAELMGLAPDDIVFTAQPFFWTAGIAQSLGATLAAGACMVLTETFDAAEALELVEREGATTVHTWPHQDKAMADHPDAARRDLSRVRHIEYASAMARHVGIEKDEWGIYGTYGLSETFTICSGIPASAPAELRAKTSGRALPGMELRIIDPATGEATDGPGEIIVRGATLMKGYYKQARAAAFDAEGFFHTQDGGHIDADGYLHWSGRLSNLIKTGGANVSPLEIEQIAIACPGVRAALAVGVPHPQLGEVIILCALPSEGQTPSEAAVREALRESLSAYKLPRRVLFFAPEEIQFTGNQKIQVGPLREAALRRLADEGAVIDGHRYAHAPQKA